MSTKKTDGPALKFSLNWGDLFGMQNLDDGSNSTVTVAGQCVLAVHRAPRFGSVP